MYIVITGSNIQFKCCIVMTERENQVSTFYFKYIFIFPSVEFTHFSIQQIFMEYLGSSSLDLSFLIVFLLLLLEKRSKEAK